MFSMLIYLVYTVKYYYSDISYSFFKYFYVVVVVIIILITKTGNETLTIVSKVNTVDLGYKCCFMLTLRSRFVSVLIFSRLAPN